MVHEVSFPNLPSYAPHLSFKKMQSIWAWTQRELQLHPYIFTAYSLIFEPHKTTSKWRDATVLIFEPAWHYNHTGKLVARSSLVPGWTCMNESKGIGNVHPDEWDTHRVTPQETLQTLKPNHSFQSCNDHTYSPWFQCGTESTSIHQL